MWPLVKFYSTGRVFALVRDVNGSEQLCIANNDPYRVRFVARLMLVGPGNLIRTNNSIPLR